MESNLIYQFLFPPPQSWLGYMEERSPVKRCSLREDAGGISDVKIHSNSSISAKMLDSNTSESEKRFPSESIVPPDLCRNHLVPKRIHQSTRIPLLHQMVQSEEFTTDILLCVWMIILLDQIVWYFEGQKSIPIRKKRVRF